MKQICKECEIEKELWDFYSHPEWKNWVLWRCKGCIKRWRKSPKEREMAREWEKDNRVRPEWYSAMMSKKFREENPEKYKAHMKVNNYLRSAYDSKSPFKTCYNCFEWWKIELHHEDYSKPNDVVPLCIPCHRRKHCWDFEINPKKIVRLPF